MKYFVSIGERDLEVELGPDGILVDGEPVSADIAEMDGTDVHSLLLSGRSHRILARRNGSGEWGLYLSGQHFLARVEDDRTRTIRELAGSKEASLGPKALRAPMPGLVVKVEVEEGDEVDVGQGLVIVEAMKMENELKAETAGRISHILVEAGQAVEKDQVLVEFESPEDSEEKESVE